MATPFPYTHYACSCSDLTSVAPSFTRNKRASTSSNDVDAEAEDRTFNPHSLRANYSLYPLQNLLFCDECDSIRCPRCWTEEVINWYCPACLFEVPSSAVKGDGNRCARNCYSCPLCTAPLAVTAAPQSREKGNTLLKPMNEETYMLQCQYCDWSSLDIDVRLAKPTKITEQLAKQRMARSPSSSRERRMEVPDESKHGRKNMSPSDHDNAFASLRNFYREQLNQTGDTQSPYSNSPYSSPANLARIMSIYGGPSVNSLKKSRDKLQPMREALVPNEGFSAYTPDESEAVDWMIKKLESSPWSSTAELSQQFSSPQNTNARFVDQLWPVATLLRTKRGKRCKTCRQFLARPDPKVGSLKWKIRLLAQNHVPRLSIRVHDPEKSLSFNYAFRLRPEDPIEHSLLKPLVAQQYVLTVRNPIFETIKVTLATPAITPGRVHSRVTILCPSFTVGPAGDVWDDALSTSTTSTSAPNDGSRRAAMASLTGREEGDSRQPEAGKIWERTRNSTSVILEIVPGQLNSPSSIVPKDDLEDVRNEDENYDVLEVPIYVRAEWETAVQEDSSEKLQKERVVGDKLKKEVAGWCVLGVGRIRA